MCLFSGTAEKVRLAKQPEFWKSHLDVRPDLETSRSCSVAQQRGAFNSDIVSSLRHCRSRFTWSSSSAQTTQHSHAAPVLAPHRLLSANLLLLASQLMPRRWTLLDVADLCLLPGSSGGLSLLDKCVKTWNTEHQVSCFFVNKVLFK